MTQNILSSMDSDEVNSINDTAESLQVANIIRTAYFNIISRANLPEYQNIFQLIGPSDVSVPVIMTKPSTVSRIDWIKYFDATDAQDEYEYVTILPLAQFLDNTQVSDPQDPDILSLTFEGMTFYYRNDGQPSYCTLVNNNYILFDSYDATIDTGLMLQGSKTLCSGQVIPDFTLGDSFTPDLEDMQFPLLLNEAKGLAFLELKQIANDHAEREARRQWNLLPKNKSVLTPRRNDFDMLPDFGKY